MKQWQDMILDSKKLMDIDGRDAYYRDSYADDLTRCKSKNMAIYRIAMKTTDLMMFQVDTEKVELKDLYRNRRLWLEMLLADLLGQ